MKKLLLITLMAIGVGANAQKKDSTFYMTKISPLFLGGSISTGNAIKYVPVYDTVKVLLLTCDTSSSSNEYIKIMPVASWRYALEAREVIKRNNAEGQIDPYNKLGFVYEEWNQYNHKEYLTLDRKPLPNNIVVWMSKTL